MTRHRRHRHPQDPLTTGSRDGPDDAGLLASRHLAAISGLLDPPPLDPRADPPLDHDCPMTPEVVADTSEGARRVLLALGQEDVLAGSELLTGLAQAAAAGWGAEIPPRGAKALWLFCDAFADHEPLLRAGARALRAVEM